MSKLTLRTFICTAVVLVVVAVAGYMFLINCERAATKQLQAVAQEREQLMREYVALLQENSATPEATAIARDCSSEDRGKFETLLAAITTLDRLKVVELERLFASCAYFYPDQQAIMVLLLREVFSEYEHLMKTIDDDTHVLAIDTDNLLLWRKIVELETTRNQLNFEQVNAQKNIINLLLNGTSQRDAAFEVERAKASEVIERMMTTRNEINRIRSEIDET